jgi:predicted DCC family thiol-disulfide oxidoreductase YuxK
MRHADRKAYPTGRRYVPSIDKGPVVFVDGHRALCGQAGRAIARFDKAGEFRICPILRRSLQDWLYRRIARNRYSIFGHANVCAMPDPALKQRLLS